jgi:hypothetical protein
MSRRRELSEGCDPQPAQHIRRSWLNSINTWPGGQPPKNWSSRYGSLNGRRSLRKIGHILPWRYSPQVSLAAVIVSASRSEARAVAAERWAQRTRSRGAQGGMPRGQPSRTRIG